LLDRKPGYSGRKVAVDAGSQTTNKHMVNRERILAQSARLFAKDGYKATNLQHVAEKLDVTRQALYYYFRSKGDILAALFDDVMTRLEERIEAVGAVDGEPRFKTMVRAHIEVIVENTELAAVLLHERSEIAKLRSVPAAARRQAYSQLFVDAYREGVRAGELRSADPTIAVNTVLGAANSISAWYHAGSPEPATAVGGLVSEILLAGVDPAPGEKKKGSRRSRS
jgi:TetR/AcrR family transcriptional regulator, cholesterol catabolism regulator